MFSSWPRLSPSSWPRLSFLCCLLLWPPVALLQCHTVTPICLVALLSCGLSCCCHVNCLLVLLCHLSHCCPVSLSLPYSVICVCVSLYVRYCVHYFIVVLSLYHTSLVFVILVLFVATTAYPCHIVSRVSHVILSSCSMSPCVFVALLLCRIEQETSPCRGLAKEINGPPVAFGL